MALIAQADIEAKIGRSLSSNELAVFNIANPALQAEVERMIGSSVETAEASTRYYHGGVQTLAIDPCTDVSAVKQVDDDDTAIYTYDTSDYVLYPKNATLKRAVIHRPSPFMEGIYNIAVTAKFSIAADTRSLAIVKNALLEALASEVGDADNIVKESIEGYSVEFSKPEISDALDAVRRLFPEV